MMPGVFDSKLRRAFPFELGKLAEEKRAKKAAELEGWRAATYNQITWDLFYLIEGPALEHPGDLVPSGPEDAYTRCQIAYYGSLARIRKAGLDEEGNINFSNVPKGDRAAAYCLQGLYNKTLDDEAAFLRSGIFTQALGLGRGLEYYEGIGKDLTFAYFVDLIDEHRGGPEWRQLGATNQEQEELDAEFGLDSITEIPPKSKPWVESAFQKKLRAEHEQALNIVEV